MVDETDPNNPEDILTDEERLEAAKKRLQEAKALLAGANIDNIKELKREVSEAEKNLYEIIDEMRPASRSKQQQTRKPKNLFASSGAEEEDAAQSASDAEEPPQNQDSSKQELEKAHADLSDLRRSYERLKQQHNDLKIAIQQTKITTTQDNAADKKVQTELQDKYEEAVNNLKSAEDRIDECNLKIQHEREVAAQEVEKKRQEQETKQGSSEQIRCSLIKLALAHLGHSAPENFKSDAFYNTVLNLYDFVKKDLLTRYGWKFALDECSLNKLATQRDGYCSYSLPADLLKIQKIVPGADYEIMGNKLLSRSEQASLFYIRQVDDMQMPEFFKSLLVYSLAAASAALVTQNEAIARKWELETNLRFCTAIASDSSQQAIHGITRNPIYAAHFV